MRRPLACRVQMEYGPIKPAECEAYRAQREKSRTEEIARFQAEMAANKAELRALVDAHGLQHADPKGGVPLAPAVVITSVLACWCRCRQRMALHAERS